jgi:hypothetical protein
MQFLVPSMPMIRCMCVKFVLIVLSRIDPVWNLIGRLWYDSYLVNYGPSVRGLMFPVVT